MVRIRYVITYPATVLFFGVSVYWDLWCMYFLTLSPYYFIILCMKFACFFLPSNRIVFSSVSFYSILFDQYNWIILESRFFF